MPPSSWEKIRAFFVGHKPGSAGRVRKRGSRFPFQVPVIYRETEGLVWYKGTTENASSKGILFRGEKYIPADTLIEMTFTPPVEAGTRKREDIFCWGEVVRTAAPSVVNARPALAAKILRYRSKPKFLSDSDTPFKTAV